MSVAAELFGKQKKTKASPASAIDSMLQALSGPSIKKRTREPELRPVSEKPIYTKRARWELRDFKHSKRSDDENFRLRHWEKAALPEVAGAPAVPVQAPVDYSAAKAILPFPIPDRNFQKAEEFLLRNTYPISAQDLIDLAALAQATELKWSVLADRINDHLPRLADLSIPQLKGLLYGFWDFPFDPLLDEQRRLAVFEGGDEARAKQLKRLQAELKEVKDSCGEVDGLLKKGASWSLAVHGQNLGDATGQPVGPAMAWMSSEERPEVSLSSRVSKIRSLYVENPQRKLRNCRSVRAWDRLVVEGAELERNLKSAIRAREKTVKDLENNV